MVEGKLKLWIRGGKFENRSDLYVKVFCDGREFWKTDEIDSYKPEWDRCVCPIPFYVHLLGFSG